MRRRAFAVFVASVLPAALVVSASCQAGNRVGAPSSGDDATRVARDASSVQELLWRYDSVVVGHVVSATVVREWPEYTFDVTQVVAARGDAPSGAIPVRQLPLPVYDVGNPWTHAPRFDMSSDYMLIIEHPAGEGDRPPGEPLDVRAFGSYAVGDDGRLHPLEQYWDMCAGASALAGLTVEEAAELVRAALALPWPTPVSPAPVTPAPPTSTPMPTWTPTMPSGPPPTWTSSPTATLTSTLTPGPSPTPTSTPTWARSSTPPTATSTPVPTVATPVSICW